MPRYRNYINIYTLKIVLIYTIVSALYILFSDHLLEALIHDIERLTKLQTYKGLGFVIITSVMLFFLVRSHMMSLSDHHRILLDQERIYRIMLENNNDVIIRINTDDEIVFCSNNLLHITGHCADNFSFEKLTAIINPIDKELFLNAIEHCKKTSGTYHCPEFRIIRPNGESVWFECTAINHLTDAVLCGIILNLNDIQHRKKSEEQIKRTEEKYSNLFNDNPLPVWIYDLETLKFIDVNEAAILHYGYSREEFLAMTLPDIRPAEDVALLMKAIDRAKKHKRNNNKEPYRHIKKNGEIIFVHIESIATAFDNHNYRMALAIDVTEHLKQQKALAESNKNLKSAQEIARIGYWSQDMQNNKVYWSEEMYKVFELNPETFDPSFEAVLQKVTEADKHLFTAIYEEENQIDDMYDIEYRIKAGNGKEKWLFNRIKLTKKDDKIVLRDGVIVDITQRKMDEQAITKKSILLNSLNKFTTGLLSNENWKIVFDKSMGIIANTIGLDNILYFEYEPEKQTGPILPFLKDSWSVEKKDIINEQIQTALREVSVIMHNIDKGLSYQSVVTAMPESQLKYILQQAGTRSVYIQPVIVNGNEYGFFIFMDSKTERYFDEDEKMFIESLASNIDTKIEKYIVENEGKITKQQFESVVTNLPGIALRRITSGEWPVIFVNEEIERITGFKAEDFIENNVRSLESIIHPEDRDNKLRRIRALMPGESFRHQFRIICSDGSIKWLRGNGRAIVDNKGSIRYIDEVLIDVTEEYEKKQQLVQSNERFRTVMKAAAEAIIDWDIVTDTSVWGDGFKEFFGYTPDKNDKTLWSRNIHPEDRDRVVNLMQEKLQDPTQESFYAEFRFMKANGEIAYVQNRCTFIRDENGKAIRGIGALADVTESMERLRKIEKQNESLREIAWIQSHIIRAPLATLLGLITAFKERDEIDIPEEELVEGIIHSANALDKVIHEIVEKSDAVSDITDV
jgi:PAS domain S-box-containing protein